MGLKQRIVGIPFTRQVMTTIVAVLVPLVASALWTGLQALGDRRAELRTEVEALAVSASAQLDEQAAAVDLAASILAADADVMAGSADAARGVFERTLRAAPMVSALALLESDGGVLAAVPALDPAAAQSRLGDLASRITLSRKSAFGDISGGPDAPDREVAVGYPVPASDGSVGRVLVVMFRLASITASLSRVPVPPGSSIRVTAGGDRTLARLAGGTGPTGLVRVLDPADVTASAVGRQWPWTVTVDVPIALARARARPGWVRAGAFNLLWVTFALLVAAFFSRQVGRSVRQLQAAATRIAAGDLSPPEHVDPPALEFAEMQDAFSTMASSLRTMKDTLDRQLEQERRMRAAMRLLERQVVRQERLAAVGLLVSGVAHELNNPLQGILGSAELLEQTEKLSPEGLEELSFLKTQSDRAREIIRSLSRFSRQQAGVPERVLLGDVVREVLRLRERSAASAGVALTADVKTARGVIANFTEVQQVVLNFVVNAQQAIALAGRTAGRIHVSIDDAGQNVRVEVSDDGPGVGRGDEAKLFQPFFTTKPVGEGTGLGLSVSYGIVDSYGGTIGYQPNSWGGASFYFELPAEGSQRQVAVKSGSAS